MLYYLGRNGECVTKTPSSLQRKAQPLCCNLCTAATHKSGTPVRHTLAAVGHDIKTVLSDQLVAREMLDAIPPIQANSISQGLFPPSGRPTPAPAPPTHILKSGGWLMIGSYRRPRYGSVPVPLLADNEFPIVHLRDHRYSLQSQVNCVMSSHG